MFIPSNVEFEAATLLFRGRQKRRIYFFVFPTIRGRWILRVMDKNIITYLRHALNSGKKKRGIVMILWLNSQDCCTSTEWNHGSYPSVNLKDFLRYLMKPPYKKHVHFFGEILCLNQQDEQCFCHPSDIPWILIGSKGSLQWLLTIPTWLVGFPSPLNTIHDQLGSWKGASKTSCLG